MSLDWIVHTICQLREISLYKKKSHHAHNINFVVFKILNSLTLKLTETLQGSFFSCYLILRPVLLWLLPSFSNSLCINVLTCSLRLLYGAYHPQCWTTTAHKEPRLKMATATLQVSHIFPTVAYDVCWMAMLVTNMLNDSNITSIHLIKSYIMEIRNLLNLLLTYFLCSLRQRQARWRRCKHRQLSSATRCGCSMLHTTAL